MESSSTKGKKRLGRYGIDFPLLVLNFKIICSHVRQVDLVNLLCIRWGFLSRAGFWDKSHLMRQIEKYVFFNFFD